MSYVGNQTMTKGATIMATTAIDWALTKQVLSHSTLWQICEVVMISIYPTEQMKRVTLRLSDLSKVTSVLTLRLKIQILSTMCQAQHDFPSNHCPLHPSPTSPFRCSSHASLLFILPYAVLSPTTGSSFAQAILCSWNVSLLLVLA